MKKVLFPLALACLLAVVVGQLAGAENAREGAKARAGATIWYVNDDLVGVNTCTAPNFASIQAANDSASVLNGDTLSVCPGTYGETTITKSLHLVAPGGKTLDSKGCRNLTNPQNNPATVAVVSGGFNVDGVDGVSIQGFTIENGDEGVHTNAATDDLLLVKNIIQNNTIGVYLNGSGHELDANCVRTNNRAGTGTGTGLLSDLGLSDSTFMKNVFAKNSNGGLGGALDLSGAVDDNLFRENGSFGDVHFLTLEGASDTEFIRNNVSGMLGTGVIFSGNNSGIKMVQNIITGGAADGVSFGDDTAPNDRILFAENTVKYGSGDAIGTVTGSALHDSLLAWNEIKQNSGQAIHIRGPASANTDNYLHKNYTSGNNAPQCLDDSGDNDWFHNGPGCTP